MLITLLKTNKHIKVGCAWTNNEFVSCTSLGGSLFDSEPLKPGQGVGALLEEQREPLQEGLDLIPI